jgi:hypothetical protein
MRGQEMARLVITKLDRFINYLTLAILIGGGLFMHLLTALTIKSYYGLKWGYIAFMLPGFSELYLVILQISAEMYNYMTVLAGFLAMSAVVALVWFFKNSLLSRFDRPIEH